MQLQLHYWYCNNTIGLPESDLCNCNHYRFSNNVRLCTIWRRKYFLTISL
jgi:hypothetical protein